MKVFYGLCAFVVLAILFFGGSTTITSCKKTVTVYDTTIVHDTTVVRDTVCDCESGMVAKYTFTGGSLSDSSGYGNNINFSNATVTTDRSGKPNNAFQFNGASQYMTVPNSNSLNPTNITLFAVVKVNAFSTGACHANQILGKASIDYMDGVYALRFTDSMHNCATPLNTNREVFYGMFGNNSPAGSGTAAQDKSIVQLGQWYRLAYTYDGKESRFYVNGVLIDKRSKVVPFTPNSQNLYIGRHQDATYPYWFNGVIDEIRIYNHAICESGIKTLSK